MMIIRKNIKGEEIKDLPKVSFTGEIITVTSEEGIIDALNYLKSYKIVGIDSETKPSFKKGKINKVSLLQISTLDRCFLFRLNRTGLTQPLIDFIENPKIIKIGLSLHDDFLMLHKRAPFEQKGFIDIQKYAPQFGIKDKSLQKIYAILFNERISKSQRMSNWEREELSPSQKVYAATDAWACLKIYNLLEELKANGQYVLQPSCTNNTTGQTETIK